MSKGPHAAYLFLTPSPHDPSNCSQEGVDITPATPINPSSVVSLWEAPASIPPLADIWSFELQSLEAFRDGSREGSRLSSRVTLEAIKAKLQRYLRSCPPHSCKDEAPGIPSWEKPSSFRM